MSNIDKMIDRLKQLENKDADASLGMAVLFDLEGAVMHEVAQDLSSQHYRRLREYVSDIQTKTNYILLILRRMKELSQSPFFRPEGVQTKTIDYFLIDLESFLYYSVSVMDLIARLMRDLYPSAGHGFRKSLRSFHRLLLWLNKHQDFDPILFQILMSKTSWFEELHQHRCNLTHDRAVFMFWTGRPPQLFFGTVRDEGQYIPNKNALEYVYTVGEGVIELLPDLEAYFIQKLKQRLILEQPEGMDNHTGEVGT